MCQLVLCLYLRERTSCASDKDSRHAYGAIAARGNQRGAFAAARNKGRGAKRRPHLDLLVSSYRHAVFPAVPGRGTGRAPTTFPRTYPCAPLGYAQGNCGTVQGEPPRGWHGMFLPLQIFNCSNRQPLSAAFLTLLVPSSSSKHSCAFIGQSQEKSLPWPFN